MSFNASVFFIPIFFSLPHIDCFPKVWPVKNRKQVKGGSNFKLNKK